MPAGPIASRAAGSPSGKEDALFERLLLRCLPLRQAARRDAVPKRQLPHKLHAPGLAQRLRQRAGGGRAGVPRSHACTLRWRAADIPGQADAADDRTLVIRAARSGWAGGGAAARSGWAGSGAAGRQARGPHPHRLVLNLSDALLGEAVGNRHLLRQARGAGGRGGVRPHGAPQHGRQGRRADRSCAGTRGKPHRSSVPPTHPSVADPPPDPQQRAQQAAALTPRLMVAAPPSPPASHTSPSPACSLPMRRLSRP